MERTSLITRLMVALAADYPNLTLSNGLPDAGSLDTYFTECPIIQERAELRETAQENDQGQLVNFEVQASTFRESTFHQTFNHKDVLLYIETVNGEAHFLGDDLNPSSFSYARKSGAGLGDNNDNTLSMTHSRSKTA